jgi:hypothetical protein
LRQIKALHRRKLNTGEVQRRKRKHPMAADRPGDNRLGHGSKTQSRTGKR